MEISFASLVLYLTLKSDFSNIPLIENKTQDY